MREAMPEPKLEVRFRGHGVIVSLTGRKGIKMIKMLKAIKNSAVNFMRDEEGAQIVEYALIIAVVSIALVIALLALGGGTFSTFIGRVTNCLTTNACV